MLDYEYNKHNLNIPLVKRLKYVMFFFDWQAICSPIIGFCIKSGL